MLMSNIWVGWPTRRSTRSTIRRWQDGQADKERDADLKDGSSKPDGHPTYQAALLTAERAWLAYRDAHCETVGLEYRGGTEEDEADGKCVNEMDRKRTVELKALLDGMHH